jgi:hypothetical protein
VAAQIITLPFRLSMRAAGLFVRTAEQAAGRAFGIADDVVGVVVRRPPEPGYAAPAEPVDVEHPVTDVAAVEVETAAAGAGPARATTIERAPTIDLDAPVETEPAHVSAQPELVEEFAEPGAEDGAGAEVTVSEPWTGYRRMTAQDVVDRLSDATPAELAAVQLYERAHRGRETVLNAVKRQLQHASGGPD